MKKHSLLGITGAAALAIALSTSTQAAPFTIDDFDVDQSQSAIDQSPGDPAGSTPVSVTNVLGGTIMNGVDGWRRF